MRPVVIASMLPRLRRRRFSDISTQPPCDIIMVELLAPQKSSKRLPCDVTSVRRKSFRRHCRVKLVGLSLPRGKYPVKLYTERIGPVVFGVAEPQTDGDCLSRANRQRIMCGGFCSCL